MINFIKSTSVVIFVSALAGLSGYLLGFNFLGIFILFFVMQYILLSFIKEWIVSYYQEQTRQKQLDKLENLSTILECAYCQTPNIMTFVPDQNEKLNFVCEKCLKNNSVNLQFIVARTTEPLDLIAQDIEQVEK
jgi:hypothetical protein